MPSPPDPRIDLCGRTALVTGASRGIGRAVAVALARAGARVVAVSRTTTSSAELAAAIDTIGGDLLVLDCDLGDRAEVHHLPAAIEREAGVIDIVVHAAGINRRAPATDFTDEAWDEVLEVNLTAPFLLTREFGRRMLERGYGKVIFIASMLSFQGGFMVPAYAASKGGVAQLTRAFANEWASRGVNVNAVAPGYVTTDMNSALIADPERFRQISERIPAGRWATAEDIAGAVLFLASDLAAYIHGTVLPVDGGWLSR